MSRWCSYVLGSMLVLAAMGFLSACGGSSSDVGFQTPAVIVISPTGSTSMDLGATQQFTASATNAQRQHITVPLFFHTSNTSVATVSDNGLVCAGTWDSLSAPQICTPGQAGTAQITASSGGVSSPPTTVYVHQHIDSIQITPVPPGPNTPCTSKDLTVNYQATAFSRNTDITSTVGQFTWIQLSGVVVKLSNTADGLENVINGTSLNQVQALASAPGLTQFYATVANVTAVPISFETCAVQSITLSVNQTSNTSFDITSTVKDRLNATITGAPLVWSSSQPTVGKGPTSGTDQATITASAPGTTSITVSCTPPTCNLGFSPSLPVYSDKVVVATGTTAETTGTVWVSTEGCGTTNNCVTAAVPITLPDNTVGSQTLLPATPNSMLFSPDGTKLFFGTDDSLQGTRGLMILDATASPTTVTLHNPITGKVLAVSPNSALVIVSDQLSSPNQVFIYNTSSATATAFQITGATAAAFSPDSLKAYIAAGNKLWVFSTQDAMTSINIANPVNDLNFLTEGAFSYLAGDATASGLTARRTCDNQIATDAGGTPQVIPLSSKPVFVRTLPDSSKIIAANTSGVDLVNIFDPNTGQSTINPAGCTPTVGVPLSDAVQSFNLGQGNFTPTQLILSLDGSKAYILAQDRPAVLVFDLVGETAPPGIALAGGTLPTQGGLSMDGSKLFVGGQDGMVHVIDTLARTDIQQVTFPIDPLTQNAGLCLGVVFQSQVSISSTTQNGTDTTYSYAVITGSDLQVGNRIVVSGMSDIVNDGIFTIKAVGGGTFTVANSNGVNSSSQSGEGDVPYICNPDLVAFRP